MLKPLLLSILAFTLSTSSFSQNFGLSGFYSFDNALGVDVFYQHNLSRFHLGYSFQFNDLMNTVVDVQQPNYGRTIIDNGDYYWLLDLGYSHIIKGNWTAHGEVGFGQSSYFTNFRDNRFSDNGYSLITKTESIVGIGANLGYLINERFEAFTGYHTLRNFQLGLRYSIPLS